MDSKLEISLLYDFYGGLIPAAQQRAVELYVNDDLSLSEVAEILSISRQGVRDSLNRACLKLRAYEKKLGLLKAYREREIASEELRSAAAEISALTDNGEIRSLCKDIAEIADRLNEREE